MQCHYPTWLRRTQQPGMVLVASLHFARLGTGRCFAFRDSASRMQPRRGRLGSRHAASRSADRGYHLGLPVRRRSSEASLWRAFNGCTGCGLSDMSAVIERSATGSDGCGVGRGLVRVGNEQEKNQGAFEHCRPRRACHRAWSACEQRLIIAGHQLASK